MTDGTVLVVSPYGREYGPPRTLEHVARALAGGGYRPVCVVPARARITPALRELDPEIHTVEQLATFPRTSDPRRLRTFIRNHLAAAAEIERLARTSEAVAVYSTSEAIFCGSLAARRLELPSIAHVIGMSIASPRWGAAVYVRLLNSVTTGFIACSSAVAQMLASFGVDEERIAVVHNGIPIAEIDAALAESGSVPPELMDGRPKVGMIAAYDSRKGHELFLTAAARIAERNPEACFYILGGVLEGQGESLAFERRVDELIRELDLKSRVVRPGFVPAPDVYRWIHAMDVVVVPSRTEAFAHALVEAMACRRPVVATAVEGNLDAFVDGHSGVYVEREPEPLAAAVLGLLDDPARAAAIGEAARERVEAFFDERVTLPWIAASVRELVRPPV